MAGRYVSVRMRGIMSESHKYEVEWWILWSWVGMLGGSIAILGGLAWWLRALIK